MKKIVNTVLMSAVGLALSMPAMAESEPRNVSASTEIELTHITPTVKKVSVELQGTKREESALDTLNDMVQDILKNSKLGVVKLPVPDTYSETPEMKAAEALEIVIRASAPIQAGQLYKICLTLQEPNTQGRADCFEDRLNNPDQTHQWLEEYLTERLNLQPKRLNYSSRAVKKELQPVSPPEPEVSPRSALGSRADRPPIASAPYQYGAEAENVSPSGELQLRNMSPSVKNISVIQKGTEREQKVLDTVYHMVVHDILKNSRLGVITIPVPGDPMATPALKVYENLEIVIGATSPIQNGQPYKVSITLQERGTQGSPRYFDYVPKDWWYFYQNLKAYLTEQLGLQPK
jgi:hypothetical protein